jgi:hypothetical protein
VLFASLLLPNSALSSELNRISWPVLPRCCSSNPSSALIFSVLRHSTKTAVVFGSCRDATGWKKTMSQKSEHNGRLELCRVQAYDRWKRL